MHLHLSSLIRIQYIFAIYFRFQFRFLFASSLVITLFLTQTSKSITWSICLLGGFLTDKFYIIASISFVNNLFFRHLHFVTFRNIESFSSFNVLTLYFGSLCKPLSLRHLFGALLHSKIIVFYCQLHVLQKAWQLKIFKSPTAILV